MARWQKVKIWEAHCVHRITRAIAAIVALGAAGCDSYPTSVTAIDRSMAPRSSANAASLSGPSSVIAIADGMTQLHIDSISGEVSVRDANGGGAIYLEHDAELLEELVGLSHAISIGDANDSAMATLNPWENSGVEPFRTFPEEAWSLAGASARSSSGPVLIRPAHKESSVTLGVPVLIAPRGTVLSLNDWPPNCPAIAEAIGNHRLGYHQKRRTVFDELRGVQGIPASRLVWRNGKPYVTLQDLRNIYASLGTALVEAKFNGLQLNVMRVMYNGYRCQQPIVVGLPTPGTVHIPPSGNGGGGGTTTRCLPQTLYYEISFDGGLTWYPFAVETYVCSPYMD